MHPQDREGRKKTRIYSASWSPLVSLLFVSLFLFFSVPGVFPHLIYSFFSTSNSSTFFCSSLPQSLSPSIYRFYSVSFCRICVSMLHADSVVASRRATFISFPLRKLSWCASPGASGRNLTFWKPLLGVVCRKLCVISNAHAAFGRIKLIDMPFLFFYIYSLIPLQRFMKTSHLLFCSY